MLEATREYMAYAAREVSHDYDRLSISAVDSSGKSLLLIPQVLQDDGDESVEHLQFQQRRLGKTMSAGEDHMTDNLIYGSLPVLLVPQVIPAVDPEDVSMSADFSDGGSGGRAAGGKQKPSWPSLQKLQKYIPGDLRDAVLTGSAPAVRASFGRSTAMFPCVTAGVTCAPL